MENIKNKLNELNIAYHVNDYMRNYTTFNLGGKVNLIVDINNLVQLDKVIKLCDEYNCKYFCIGCGSNLLVSDNGYDGIVLRMINNEYSDILFKLSDGKYVSATKENLNLITEEKVFVKIPAGFLLKNVIYYLAELGLSGMEFAYGIPGSIGGALYMNAGAYDGEMKDIVTTVYTNKGEFSNKDMEFSYRHSKAMVEKFIIVSGEFLLEKKDKKLIFEKMFDLMEKRVSKQPLEYPSAGSTFKRPEGAFASKLIDDCGLRGFRIGGVGVSEKHTGFIVNYGNGTTEDVIKLINYVQKVVKDETGFILEPEVQMLGEIDDIF